MDRRVDVKGTQRERYLSNYPFGALLAQGRVEKHADAQVTAFSNTIGTTPAVVWDGMDEQAFPDYPTTAAPVILSSDSANDTNGGTGLWTLRHVGLDTNWEPLSEIVTTNGLTGVPTVNSYIRSLSLEGLTGGALETNDGRIWGGAGVVTAGVPATKYIAIRPGQGKSLHGAWSNGASRKAQALSVFASSGVQGNSELLVVFFVRPFGGIWTNRGPYYLGGGNQIDPTQVLPKAFPEKADFQLRAQTTSGAGDVSLVMQIMVKED